MEPNPKQRAALQRTFELRLLPAAAYSEIFGSAANRSEQLKGLVSDGLLACLTDPIATGAGRKPLVYTLTAKAYPYLAPFAGPGPRPDPLFLTEALFLGSEQRVHTAHTRDVATFAGACLTGLRDWVDNWHGESSARMVLPAGGDIPARAYLEPDGVLSAPTTTGPAWLWYECDRGSEHRTKWMPKLRRYAWLRGHPTVWARYGPTWPELLITVQSESSAVEIAGYCSELLIAYPLLDEWPIWIGLHDEVAHPARMADPLWWRVRRTPPRPHAPTLEPLRWSLRQLLTLDDPPTAADPAVPPTAVVVGALPPIDLIAIARRAAQEVDHREAAAAAEYRKREEARLLLAAITAEEARREAARQAELTRRRQEAARQAAELERRRQEAAAQAQAEAARQAALVAAEAARQTALAAAQQAARDSAARQAAWTRRAKEKLAAQHRAFAALRAYYQQPRGRVVYTLAHWSRRIDLALGVGWLLGCWGIDPAVRGSLDQLQLNWRLAVAAMVHPAFWAGVLTVVVLVQLIWYWQRPSLRLGPLGRGQLPLWLWAGVLERGTLLVGTVVGILWWQLPLLIRLPADLADWQILGWMGAQKIVVAYVIGYGIYWAVEDGAAWLNVPVPLWWSHKEPVWHNVSLDLRGYWPPYRIMPSPH